MTYHSYKGINLNTFVEKQNYQVSGFYAYGVNVLNENHNEVSYANLINYFDIMNDKVNHPSYYTSHPSGIECIDIVRHYNFDVGNVIKYLWRAGLKQEKGYTNKEKEIEDCKKALFYLNDYIKQLEK